MGFIPHPGSTKIRRATTRGLGRPGATSLGAGPDRNTGWLGVVLDRPDRKFLEFVGVLDVEYVESDRARFQESLEQAALRSRV